MSANATKTVKKIIKRDGPWCHYCGYETRGQVASGDRIAPTRDHILPRALGGTNDLYNLRLAHRFCNSLRGVGTARNDKSELKFQAFINDLKLRGFRCNPLYDGPTNHFAKIPDRLQPTTTRRFFFSIGAVQIDIRTTKKGYWHLRLGSKTYAMAEIGAEAK